MSAEHRTVLAFDLYGTLLATESIATELGKHFSAQQADAIAASWRKYQLEYTWRLNSMQQFQSFSQVTRSALCHALDEHAVRLEESQVSDLMQAYNSLSVFPDVVPTITALEKRSSSMVPYIFSNGTQDMVNASVASSQDLERNRHVFAGIVTVEAVRRYKPAPEVYHHLAQQAGKQPDSNEMASMWLVSGNPFDIVGARAVGMNAVWIDRKGHHSSGTGWSDRLVDREKGPTAVVKSLDEVIDVVERHAASVQ